MCHGIQMDGPWEPRKGQSQAAMLYGERLYNYDILVLNLIDHMVFDFRHKHGCMKVNNNSRWLKPKSLGYLHRNPSWTL